MICKFPFNDVCFSYIEPLGLALLKHSKQSAKGTFGCLALRGCPTTDLWLDGESVSVDFFPCLPASSCKFSMFQILGGVYVGMVTIMPANLLCCGHTIW